jgi:ATP-binding cassette, subfamily B, bacterial PglK
MRILLELWRLLDGPQRRRLIALQLLSVSMALSTVIGVAAVVPFFAVLADPAAINHSAILHALYQRLGVSSREFVTLLGAGFTAVVVISNIINMLGARAMCRFSFNVGERLQVSLFDEYLNRDYEFHLRTNGALLTTKVLHETARISGGILQNSLILITNAVTAVFIIISIMILNPLFALGSVAALGLCYVAIYLITRRRLRQNGLLESQHFARRNRIVAESFGAIKEIIVLNAGTYFVRQFAQVCRPISTSLASTAAIAQNPRFVLEIATVLGLVTAALLLSGGSAADPWIAQLSFIGLAAYRLLPALQQVFAAIAKIRSDGAAFDSIGVDLTRTRNRRAPAEARRAWIDAPEREIRLERVTYRYGEGHTPALADLTLQIGAGSTVGFMGANGSGKTTLLDLVAGLLTPQSGRIEIDGVALSAANRHAWRSQVAYVPQRILLLDATFAANVAFGVPSAEIDMNRVRSAVRLAHLGECVSSLPRGYAAMLGEWGSQLSGGQQQRLAIARAMYRGARVLIMDEITSALDSAAELELIDMLANLGQGRTLLMVAHRLSSLRHCEVIYEMEHGRIVRSTSRAQFERLRADLASA